MKKVLMVIAFSGVLALCFAACGSMESDAKKPAKMHYDLE